MGVVLEMDQALLVRKGLFPGRKDLGNIIDDALPSVFCDHAREVFCGYKQSCPFIVGQSRSHVSRTTVFTPLSSPYPVVTRRRFS